MSAPRSPTRWSKAHRSGKYDFVLVNFANPDMVGHTGKLDAAIAGGRGGRRAASARIVDAGCAKRAARVIITADHGNCEQMIDPATGGPHTAHTLNPVPLLYVNDARPQARSSAPAAASATSRPRC